MDGCSVSKEKHADTGAQGRQSRMTASLRITRGVGDYGATFSVTLSSTSIKTPMRKTTLIRNPLCNPGVFKKLHFFVQAAGDD